jgi:UDP-N-acetylmuramate dehydrogenase
LSTNQFIGEQTNVDLQGFNTFGIKARAHRLFRLESLEQLTALSQLLKDETQVFILGGGSNLLITQDIQSTVIQVALRGIQAIETSADSVLVEAGAGEPWHEFVLECLRQGWFGLENLSLIPGSVGASPVQNIGAYGVEMRECFESLTAWHWHTGELKQWRAAECQFAYRDSVFKHPQGKDWVILSVRFRLHTGAKGQASVNFNYADLKKQLEPILSEGRQPTPQEVSEAVCTVRASKLPDPAQLGNAGSFFKNPVVANHLSEQLAKVYPALPAWPVEHGTKLSAAWLIDQAGWKGFRKGDAGVHKNHALVLVNYGSATGQEMMDLARNIQASVYQRFGIRIEPEPIIL